MSQTKYKADKLAKITMSTAIVASSFSFIAPLASAAPFADVNQSNTHYDAIMDLANRDIINGYEDGTFKPENFVTRGQAAKIIAKALNLDVTAIEDPKFLDVNKNSEFYPYIAVLANHGVINGYDGKYNPSGHVTRGQMAKIIARAFEITSTEKAAFKDVPANHEFAPYINALAENNITLGKADGKFAMHELVTRGQLASFVTRAEKVVATTAIEGTITHLDKNSIDIDGKAYKVPDNASFLTATTNKAALEEAKIVATVKNNEIVSITDLTLLNGNEFDGAQYELETLTLKQSFTTLKNIKALAINHELPTSRVMYDNVIVNKLNAYAATVAVASLNHTVAIEQQTALQFTRSTISELAVNAKAAQIEVDENSTIEMLDASNTSNLMLNGQFNSVNVPSNAHISGTGSIRTLLSSAQNLNGITVAQGFTIDSARINGQLYSWNDALTALNSNQGNNTPSNNVSDNTPPPPPAPPVIDTTQKDEADVEAALTNVKAAIQAMTVTNALTEAELKATIDTANTLGATVTVTDFEKTMAEAGKAGTVTFKVVVTKGNTTQSYNANLTIAALSVDTTTEDTADVQAVIANVEKAVSTIEATNELNEADVKATVEQLDARGATVTVSDFTKTAATEGVAGSITFKVAVTKGEATEVYNASLTIAALPVDTTAQDEADVKTVMANLEATINGLAVTNGLTEAQVKAAVATVETLGAAVEVTDFQKQEATEGNSGVVTFKVTVTKGKATESYSANLTIAALPVDTTEQDTTDVKAVIANVEKALQHIEATNELTEADVKAVVESIESLQASVTVENFEKVVAGQGKTGAITFKVAVTKGKATEVYNASLTIAALPVDTTAQDTADVQAVIASVEKAVSALEATNALTEANVKAVVAQVDAQGATVTVSDFQKVEATEGVNGTVTFKVTVEKGKATESYNANLTIAALPVDTTAQDTADVQAVIANVEKAVSALEATNALTEEDVKAVVAQVDAQGATVTVSNFVKTAAEEGKAGTVTFKVTVEKGKATESYNASLTIAALPVDTTAQDTADVQAVIANVEKAVSALETTNALTEANVKAIVAQVDAQGTTVIVSDFAKTAATEGVAGSITFKVAVTKGKVAEVYNASLVIAALPVDTTAQDTADVQAVIANVEKAVNGLAVTNALNEDQVTAAIATVEALGATVTMTNFQKAEAAEGQAGSITFKVVVTKGKATESYNANLTIEALPVDTTAQDTADVQAVISNVEKAVSAMEATNALTEANVKAVVAQVDAQGATVTVSDFAKTAATEGVAGSITFKVAVTKGKVAEVYNASLVIAALPVDTTAQDTADMQTVMEDIKKAINALTITNGLTEAQVKAAVQLVNALDATVTVSDFVKTAATEGVAGSITFKVAVTKGKVTESYNADLTIAALPVDTTAQDIADVENVMTNIKTIVSKFDVTNALTEAQVKEAIDMVESEGTTVTVSNFKKVKANEGIVGSITFDVAVSKEKASETYSANLSIAALESAPAPIKHVINQVPTVSDNGQILVNNEEKYVTEEVVRALQTLDKLQNSPDIAIQLILEESIIDDSIKIQAIEISAENTVETINLAGISKGAQVNIIGDNIAVIENLTNTAHVVIETAGEIQFTGNTDLNEVTVSNVTKVTGLKANHLTAQNAAEMIFENTVIESAQFSNVGEVKGLNADNVDITTNSDMTLSNSNIENLAIADNAVASKMNRIAALSNFVANTTPTIAITIGADTQVSNIEINRKDIKIDKQGNDVVSKITINATGAELAVNTVANVVVNAGVTNLILGQLNKTATIQTLALSLEHDLHLTGYATIGTLNATKVNPADEVFITRDSTVSVTTDNTNGLLKPVAESEIDNIKKYTIAPTSDVGIYAIIEGTADMKIVQLRNTDIPPDTLGTTKSTAYSTTKGIFIDAETKQLAIYNKAGELIGRTLTDPLSRPIIQISETSSSLGVVKFKVTTATMSVLQNRLGYLALYKHTKISDYDYLVERKVFATSNFASQFKLTTAMSGPHTLEVPATSIPSKFSTVIITGDYIYDTIQTADEDQRIQVLKDIAAQNNKEILRKYLTFVVGTTNKEYDSIYLDAISDALLDENSPIFTIEDLVNFTDDKGTIEYDKAYDTDILLLGTGIANVSTEGSYAKVTVDSNKLLIKAKSAGTELVKFQDSTGKVSYLKVVVGANNTIESATLVANEVSTNAELLVGTGRFATSGGKKYFIPEAENVKTVIFEAANTSTAPGTIKQGKLENKAFTLQTTTNFKIVSKQSLNLSGAISKANLTNSGYITTDTDLYFYSINDGSDQYKITAGGKTTAVYISTANGTTDSIITSKEFSNTELNLGSIKSFESTTTGTTMHSVYDANQVIIFASDASSTGTFKVESQDGNVSLINAFTTATGAIEFDDTAKSDATIKVGVVKETVTLDTGVSMIAPATKNVVRIEGNDIYATATGKERIILTNGNQLDIDVTQTATGYKMVVEVISGKQFNLADLGLDDIQEIVSNPAEDAAAKATKVGNTSISVTGIAKKNGEVRFTVKDLSGKTAIIYAKVENGQIEVAKVEKATDPINVSEAGLASVTTGSWSNPSTLRVEQTGTSLDFYILQSGTTAYTVQDAAGKTATINLAVETDAQGYRKVTPVIVGEKVGTKETENSPIVPQDGEIISGTSIRLYKDGTNAQMAYAVGLGDTIVKLADNQLVKYSVTLVDGLYVLQSSTVTTGITVLDTEIDLSGELSVTGGYDTALISAVTTGNKIVFNAQKQNGRTAVLVGDGTNEVLVDVVVTNGVVTTSVVKQEIAADTTVTTIVPTTNDLVKVRAYGDKQYIYALKAGTYHYLDSKENTVKKVVISANGTAFDMEEPVVVKNTIKTAADLGLKTALQVQSTYNDEVLFAGMVGSKFVAYQIGAGNKDVIVKDGTNQSTLVHFSSNTTTGAEIFNATIAVEQTPFIIDTLGKDIDVDLTGDLTVAVANSTIAEMHENNSLYLLTQGTTYATISNAAGAKALATITVSKLNGILTASITPIVKTVAELREGSTTVTALPNNGTNTDVVRIANGKVYAVGKGTTQVKLDNQVVNVIVEQDGNTYTITPGTAVEYIEIPLGDGSYSVANSTFTVNDVTNTNSITVTRDAKDATDNKDDVLIITVAANNGTTDLMITSNGVKTVHHIHVVNGKISSEPNKAIEDLSTDVQGLEAETTEQKVQINGTKLHLLQAGNTTLKGTDGLLNVEVTRDATTKEFVAKQTVVEKQLKEELTASGEDAFAVRTTGTAPNQTYYLRALKTQTTAKVFYTANYRISASTDKNNDLYEMTFAERHLNKVDYRKFGLTNDATTNIQLVSEDEDLVKAEMHGDELILYAGAGQAKSSGTTFVTAKDKDGKQIVIEVTRTEDGLISHTVAGQAEALKFADLGIDKTEGTVKVEGFDTNYLQAHVTEAGISLAAQKTTGTTSIVVKQTIDGVEVVKAIVNINVSANKAIPTVVKYDATGFTDVISGTASTVRVESNVAYATAIGTVMYAKGNEAVQLRVTYDATTQLYSITPSTFKLKKGATNLDVTIDEDTTFNNANSSIAEVYKVKNSSDAYDLYFVGKSIGSTNIVVINGDDKAVIHTHVKESGVVANVYAHTPKVAGTYTGNDWIQVRDGKLYALAARTSTIKLNNTFVTAKVTSNLVTNEFEMELKRVGEVFDSVPTLIEVVPTGGVLKSASEIVTVDGNGIYAKATGKAQVKVGNAILTFEVSENADGTYKLIVDDQLEQRTIKASELGLASLTVATPIVERALTGTQILDAKVIDGELYIFAKGAGKAELLVNNQTIVYVEIKTVNGKYEIQTPTVVKTTIDTVGPVTVKSGTGIAYQNTENKAEIFVKSEGITLVQHNSSQALYKVTATTSNGMLSVNNGIISTKLFNGDELKELDNDLVFGTETGEMVAKKEGTKTFDYSYTVGGTTYTVKYHVDIDASGDMTVSVLNSEKIPLGTLLTKIDGTPSSSLLKITPLSDEKALAVTTQNKTGTEIIEVRDGTKKILLKIEVTESNGVYAVAHEIISTELKTTDLGFYPDETQTIAITNGFVQVDGSVVKIYPNNNLANSKQYFTITGEGKQAIYSLTIDSENIRLSNGNVTGFKVEPLYKDIPLTDLQINPVHVAIDGTATWSLVTVGTEQYLRVIVKDTDPSYLILKDTNNNYKSVKVQATKTGNDYTVATRVDDALKLDGISKEALNGKIRAVEDNGQTILYATGTGNISYENNGKLYNSKVIEKETATNGELTFDTAETVNVTLTTPRLVDGTDVIVNSTGNTYYATRTGEATYEVAGSYKKLEIKVESAEGTTFNHYKVVEETVPFEKLLASVASATLLKAPASIKLDDTTVFGGTVKDKDEEIVVSTKDIGGAVTLYKAKIEVNNNVISYEFVPIVKNVYEDTGWHTDTQYTVTNSNSSVARIDANGTIYFVRPGEATFTFKTTSGITRTLEYKMHDNYEVELLENGPDVIQYIAHNQEANTHAVIQLTFDLNAVLPEELDKYIRAANLIGSSDIATTSTSLEITVAKAAEGEAASSLPYELVIVLPEYKDENGYFQEKLFTIIINRSTEPNTFTIQNIVKDGKTIVEFVEKSI